MAKEPFMTSTEHWMKFVTLADAAGITTRKCCETHWQATGSNGTVNYWPTTRKWQLNGTQGKARRGSIEDVIRAAGGAKPAAKPVERGLPPPWVGEIAPLQNLANWVLVVSLLALFLSICSLLLAIMK